MFSLPLHFYQQSARSTSHDSGIRKRKRKGSRTPKRKGLRDPKATESDAGSSGSHSPSPRSTISAVLTPDDIYQYAVAGQSVKNGLPRYPFPHAEYGNRHENSRFEYELRQQLETDQAFLTGNDNHAVIQSLHQQHLAVMTTILHRSLMEENFVRAGKALGMILRDESGGKPIDIRAQGRWGVGAEILIRQGAQREYRSREQSSPFQSEPNSSPERPRIWFTRKGFEDAKRYYERLIVQYPFVKANPGAVSALDFYPAMFGLWIYVVHHEAKLNSLQRKSEWDYSEGDEKSRDKSALIDTDQSSTYRPTLEELLQAKEIADRMDSLMTALPYREDADLLNLRRMVQLWIRDLEEALMMPADSDDITDQREDSPMQYLTSGVTNVSLQSLS